MAKKRLDGWFILSIVMFIAFIFILVYPMFGLMKQSVIMPDGSFSWEEFEKFFSHKYYTQTILNSFKVTITTTILSLVLGVPFAYFYSFYKIKGSKILFVVSILCCMSAPFLGAYSWIMLLGRSGVITKFIKATFGIVLPSIYGFRGIVLSQVLNYFPLVFIYMNGAFRNTDSTLMEAAENMGCTGVKRLFKIVLNLSMPTLLASTLMVLMQSFSDFGTPSTLGEDYKTFLVLLYNEYLGETGQDYNYAAALAIIAVVLAAIVFFLQKWATSKYKFSINALHPVQKKNPKGILAVIIYVYCYLLCAIAILPQAYVVYLSFRNCKGSVWGQGLSFNNYKNAMKKKLLLASRNSVFMGILALVAIIVIAVLIAYLVVRRANALNHLIDSCAMLPYIMPGAVIGIALVIAFGKHPFALTGTMTIMVLSFVIRRMPYTIRSATATLMHIPESIEEAAISLGASKIATFVKVTVPMMSSGILSGAILSWVAIVTELSSSVILYSNRTTTLTMQAYIYIGRGEYGTAAAFAAILNVITTISLLIYMKVSKSEDNVKL